MKNILNKQKTVAVFLRKIPPSKLFEQIVVVLYTRKTAGIYLTIYPYSSVCVHCTVYSYSTMIVPGHARLFAIPVLSKRGPLAKIGWGVLLGPFKKIFL